MIKRNFFLLTLLSLLTSCEVNKDSNVTMDSFSFISNFPHSGSLEELDSPYDEIGIRSMKVIDSLVIIDHRKNWNITDTSLTSLAHCFSIGAGPGEFLSIPYTQSSAYRLENDSLVAYVYDPKARNIKRANLTRLISLGDDDVRVSVSRGLMPELLWDVIPCDSTTFLMHVPNETITGFKRIIYSNGEEKEIEITKPLSDRYVDDSSDINLLAKVSIYDPNSDRFVEAMTHLNQINMYSRDGSWGRTICVGNKLDDLSAVQATGPAYQKRGYLSLSSIGKGFAASYSGMTEMDFELKGQSSTDIHIFNWDGEPIYKLTFPFQVSFIDIDYNNNILYVIDVTDDRLRKYDATPVINAFM